MAWTNGWNLLPPLVDGFDCWAVAVSADGTTVVGYGNDASSVQHVLLWRASGLVDLGLGPAGSTGGQFTGINNNGTIGCGYYTDASSNTKAFIWTQGSGFTDLGSLSGFPQNSAFGISLDGTAITGNMFGGASAPHAFRWTSGSGLVDISPSIASGDSATGFTFSPDGTLIAGSHNVSGGGYTVEFLWSAGGGLVDTAPHIPPPPSMSSSGSNGCVALTNSAICQVVGFVDSDAYIYEVTPSVTAPVILPRLSGSTFAAVEATNFDGSVMTGQGDNSGSTVCLLVWVNQLVTGIVPLTDYNSPQASEEGASLIVLGSTAYIAGNVFRTADGIRIPFVFLFALTPAPAPVIGLVPPLIPTAQQRIIPSYLYEEYNDDAALQTFVNAQNICAQEWLDWSNAINLPIYVALSGALLDWVGAGLYGYPRPVLNTTTTTYAAGYNTTPYNTIAYNEELAINTNILVPVNDDIYKRMLTWHLWKGDGFQYTTRWLKQRIHRFLNGANGVLLINDNTDDVSVTSSGSSVTITLADTPISEIFQIAINDGVLALPFQFSYTVSLV